MDHATEVELIERLLAHMAAGTRDMAEREARNPVVDYFDTTKHQWELDVLFRDFPILVAHSSQLRRPGDFVTHDETGVPILLVRAGSGALNAFINVCRHRGSVIVRERAGSGRAAFHCPYHGWSYDRDGRLSRIPDEIGFSGIDTASRGLVRLPVAEKHGFVWVRPAPGEEIDIDAYLGPLGADLAGHDMASHCLYKPAPDHVHEELRRGMNWKLMVDTFLEAYHFRYAHTKSVYPLFTDNVALYEPFGRHVRAVVPKRSLAELAGTDPATWRLRDHSIVLYFLFPNTMIVLMADHVSVFAMFPRGPEEAVLLLSFYLPEEPEGEEAWAYWKMNAELIRDALVEDFHIGEGAQRGFHSGANEHIVYGRFERGLDCFHSAVNEVLAEAGYNGP